MLYIAEKAGIEEQVFLENSLFINDVIS